MNLCQNLDDLYDAIRKQPKDIVVDGFSFHGTLPREIGQLIKLESLSLHGFTTIPPEISNLTNLKAIYYHVPRQQLKIPPELGLTPNLSYFCLSIGGDSSTIGYFPDGIDQLKSISYLEIDGYNIDRIPPEIGCLSDLRELILDCVTHLPELPAELSNLTQLETLKVQTRDMGNAYEKIYNLTNLTSLSLELDFKDKNGLPSGINKLVNLTSLRISSSHLKHLPKEIGELKNLKHLIFDSLPDLSNLPEELRNIQDLALEMNYCGGGSDFFKYSSDTHEQFPPGLEKLTNLSSLSISGVVFGPSFFSAVSQLKDLKSLKIDFRHGTKNPIDVSHLTNLRELHIQGLNSGTQINISKLIENRSIFIQSQTQTVALDNLIKQLPLLRNLESLSLPINDMVEFPVSLLNLKGLKKLDLSGNIIESLPEELGNLSNLEELNLDDNHIIQLPLSFLPLLKNKSISFKGNVRTKKELIENLKERAV